MLPFGSHQFGEKQMSGVMRGSAADCAPRVGKAAWLWQGGVGEYQSGCREEGEGRVRSCHIQLACLRTRPESDKRTACNTTSVSLQQQLDGKQGDGVATLEVPPGRPRMMTLTRQRDSVWHPSHESDT